MKSPLHDLGARLGARFVDFGGWQMPVQFESVLAEHHAVRDSVGVFDVSHLGRFALRGPGARRAVDYLLCNDLERIEPGKTQYSMMLNQEGGIVDDLIVWWWGDGSFWILPNAANHDLVMGRFAAEEGCEVDDLRPKTVLLAVQGPDAPALLESTLGASPGRFRTLEVEFLGSPVYLAGTGYTGERGGEICTDPDTGEALVDAMVVAGARPCGLGARDTLRLEAGLALWGEDIDETTTPVEAGLDFAVGLNHEFVGRGPVADQMKRGAGRRLTGFVLEEKGIPRSDYPLYSGASVGTVTSGNLSPVLKSGIGIGYMSPPVGVDQPIEVGIRDRRVKGRTAAPPFHKSP